MSTDHQRGVEAVAAKIRSPATFPGETATKVAEELIAAYIEAGGFDSVHAPVETELPAVKVSDEMVEAAAEAYWLEVYGRHRKSQKWPDDVYGRSEVLFRDGCRAALNAVFSKRNPPSTPADQLLAQIDEDRYFFLKAQAAESRCEELAEALAERDAEIASYQGLLDAAIDDYNNARNTALEEAAKICDGARALPNGVAVALAATIRSLIPKQGASDDLKEAEGVVR